MSAFTFAPSQRYGHTTQCAESNGSCSALYPFRSGIEGVTIDVACGCSSSPSPGPPSPVPSPTSPRTPAPVALPMPQPTAEPTSISAPAPSTTVSACGEGDSFSVVSETLPVTEGCYQDTGLFVNDQVLYTISGNDDYEQMWMMALELAGDATSTAGDVSGKKGIHSWAHRICLHGTVVRFH